MIMTAIQSIVLAHSILFLTAATATTAAAIKQKKSPAAVLEGAAKSVTGVLRNNGLN